MLAKGTLLHEEKPFIHVLSSNFRFTRCDQCYAKTELLKCSGCRYVRYCDRGCQKQGWTDHKSECTFMKRLPNGRFVPNSARLIARIIMKLKRGGDREMGTYAKNKYRMFKDLMSHYSDIKEDVKRREHIVSLYEVLREYMGEEHLPNSAEFVGLYGRVIVNSFNILDQEMGSIGTGIYLGASTIDHSCEPNAVATFRGTTIYIRALQDFLVYDWSKVRISYIDLLKTGKERRNELSAQYYFLCDCSRCLNIEEEKLMNSMLCPNLTCGKPIPIDVSVDGNEVAVECSFCSEVISEEKCKEFLKVSQFTEQQLIEMKDFAYLDVCKTCLSKQAGLFHPMNIYHVKTLDSAFESSIQLTKWTDSESMGERLTPGYRKYYGELHPLLGLHYMRLGKIYLYKDRIREAMESLEKAEAIISITHGKCHELYKHQLYPLILDAKIAIQSL